MCQSAKQSDCIEASKEKPARGAKKERYLLFIPENLMGESSLPISKRAALSTDTCLDSWKGGHAEDVMERVLKHFEKWL